MYNAIKEFYLNAVLLNFLFIKVSWKKVYNYFPQKQNMNQHNTDNKKNVYWTAN